MTELKAMLVRIIRDNGNFVSGEKADSCLNEFNKLEQRLKEAEEVIGFYEEHSKVSGDFDEVPTVTIFSVTGLNHKNSGSGEIHGTYKRYGKRARAYFEKYGEKEGGEGK